MVQNVSTRYHEAVNANGQNLPLVLLEISHANLATPVRVVNDTQDIVSNGNTYTAMAFRATLPDDLNQGSPRAKLSIDNIGRELTQWIEQTAGGEGATVRFMQVLRSDPDVLEFDIAMALDNMSMNMLEITGDLGFDDVLNRPACNVNYRPEIAPGLF